MATTKIPFRQRRPLFDQAQSIPLEWLGWSNPILHSACDYLYRQFCRGKRWDLDHCIVVLPGSYAGRRLLQLLAIRAQEKSLIMRPPEVLTLGELPERLYVAKHPFASDLEQLMAWTRVLRATDPTILQPLLFEVPSADELRPWMELARILSKLHRELASDLVDFDDVAHELKGTAEEERWQILTVLQRGYLDILHEAGLWDVQSARRFAIDHQEMQTDREIIAVATVDLNRAQQRFLAAVASNVRVLVGAPESFRDGFQPDGSLQADYWQDIEIPIDAPQLHVRNNVDEAADELARQLALLEDHRSVQEITVGVPDPTIVAALQETVARAGVTLRNGPGTPVSQTPPMRIVEAIDEYLEDGSIEVFHRLIRLPAIYDWLGRQLAISTTTEPTDPPTDTVASFLNDIDLYCDKTMIRSVNAPEWPEEPGKQSFLIVLRTIDKWLEPMRAMSRRLSLWAEPMRSVLHALHEGVVVSVEDAAGNLIARAADEINLVLTKLASLPSNLDLEATHFEALAWMRQELASRAVPPPQDDSAIEMLGWLDLALDDTPVLLLTGLHDGIVPECVNGDAFLPNQLRTLLGLTDNARRYARDSYAMMTMLHTRHQVEIVLNHLNPDGDPQTPSRLLLAVPSQELSGRVKHLLDPDTQTPSIVVESQWKPKSGQTNIPIPLPEFPSSDHPVPIRDMAVTDFKKYDQCPYRFYLSRVKKLKSFEHGRTEMDGGGFGDIVHKCLEGLMDSPVAASTDPESIAAWLTENLIGIARAQFGANPAPEIKIQIEQASGRLAVFAHHQAAQAALGWRINKIELEVKPSDGITLDVDGTPIRIYGRIDRIDYNPKEARYAIWDYKTGDKTTGPREAHVNRNGVWHDWQLPLYGQLIKKLKIEDLSKVSFGYISLSKNLGDIGFKIANFTWEEMNAALESAKGIARKVRAGEFWPPSYEHISQFDGYRSITQYTVPQPWDPVVARAESDDARMAQRAAKLHPSPTLPPLESDEVSSINSSIEASATQRTMTIKGKRLRLDSVDGPNKLRLVPHRAIGTPERDWFSPSMILASAGTGKTYNLATRAIRLLFSDQELDSILATTFTRKAAGEILHRILSWLADGIETQQGYERLETLLSPLTIDRDVVRYQLGRLCSHLHRFRVSTLDSFYQQLARSFSLELKLPPGWSLADEFQIDQLKHESISRMFETIDRAALKSLVSQLSKGDAVRSIRREIEDVVRSGYDLYRRTNEDAWNQLIVPRGPSESEVMHAVRIVKTSELEHKSYANARDALVSHFESKEWGEFLSLTLIKNLKEGVTTFSRKELPGEVSHAMEILAKKAVSEELASRRSQNEAAYRLLKLYHDQLKQVKSRRLMVTFDDIAERLSAWMVKTIEEHRERQDATNPKSMQSIAYRLDCRTDHLLLDEFQDTSPLQWDIIKPFAESIAIASHRSQSFFCVGDSKQAIYGWRGGVSEIFESVGKQIDNVRQEKLVKSFRSSPVVIDFVNAVFTQLDKHSCYYTGDEADIDSSDQETVKNWMTRYFSKHETAKGDLPGYVEFANVQCKKKQHNDSDEESSPGLLDEVCDRITTLHRASPETEIGVLTRRNADVVQIIELLRARGVVASQEGGSPLTDSSAVLLLLSLMQVANHPSDSLSFFHVSQSPLASRFDGELLSDPERLSARVREQIDAHGFGKTIGSLCNLLACDCNARDQERLKQLIRLAYRFDTFQQKNLNDFIEFVERERVSVPGASSVRVMTIHQSKGLEFDAVFLPTLDQTIISRTPTFVAMYEDRTKPPIGVMRYMNRDLQKHLSDAWRIAFREFANQQLAEATCLFYVAMTRARQALYLYTAPSGSPKKRWGSVLHSIFANESQRDTVCEIVRQGNPHWYLEREPNAVHASPVDANHAMDHVRVAPIRLRRSTGLIRRLPWLRPSQIQAQPNVSLSQRWLERDTIGSTVGKLVHCWFEEIRGWIDDFKPNKKRLKEIASATLTQEEMTQVKLNEWIDRFVRYCEMPSVLKALSSDRYRAWHSPRMLHLEVTNERRLLQVMDNQMLRGSIDRCVLGFDGDRVVRAEILDFKSDRRPEGMELDTWVQERAEHHGPQLRFYRRALSEQFELHPNDIALTLLLLSEDVEIAIPNN